jgi:DNA-binding LacI/PurR family transcriptional regulator
VPTIFDVAAAAGLSHQTVSRVLNGDTTVRPHNRERVETAVRELGYRRSAAARALASRKTRTIGLIAAGLPLYGPASMVHSFNVAARQIGWDVAIAAVEEDDESDGRHLVEALLSQDVQGLVFVAPTPSILDLLERTSFTIPIVTAGRSAIDGVVSVALDQQAGAALAVRHLASLGHRAVLHLAGPQDWLDARDREAGWRAESTRLGMPLLPIIRGDWSAAAGYAIARQVADRPEVTAVFSANDQMALGLLRGFEELGVRAPDGVSVVGFDDIPEAAFLVPSLTTVRQDFGALGRAVMAELDGLLADPAAAGDEVLLPTELIVRASTGPI